MAGKRYIDKTVLQASRERISLVFDSFEKYYISFSGGKDSTVMTHLVMEEAIKRGKKVGLLIIDLEAQYENTIEHIREIVRMYKDNIELHWFRVAKTCRRQVYTFQSNRWRSRSVLYAPPADSHVQICTDHQPCAVFPF